jgi:hypothetical protein
MPTTCRIRQSDPLGFYFSETFAPCQSPGPILRAAAPRGLLEVFRPPPEVSARDAA